VTTWNDIDPSDRYDLHRDTYDDRDTPPPNQPDDIPHPADIPNDVPTLWRITWSYRDSFGDPIDHDRIVIAPPPDTTADHDLDAIPGELHLWAQWIGRANYGTDLAAIEYGIESPTNLIGATFDHHGSPHVTGGQTTIICTVRYPE